MVFMREKRFLKLAAFIVACCIAVTTLSVGLVTFSFTNEEPAAFIRGALKKETENLRVSELLEVVTTGFAANAKLSYTYTITTTSKSNKSGITIYNTSDLANTDKDGVGKISTGGSNSKTPDDSKAKYFAVAEKSSSTVYGDQHLCTVTVKVTDINNPGDTATCSYTNFKPSDLRADVDGMVVILFKGQNETLTDLYGLNGVTHITCSFSHTKDGSIKDTNVATYDSGKIKAKNVGVTELTVTVYKDSSCAFHRGQNAEAVKNTIYVVNNPVANADGSITIPDVPVGVNITVNGVTKISTPDLDDLTFTDLTPGTEYKVEASITDENTKNSSKTETKIKTPTLYNITVNATPSGFGTASANYTACTSGTKVVISAEPTNSDYALDSISYKKGTSTTSTNVGKDSDGAYSFTMPSNNVTVTVKFKQVVFHPTSVEVTPESSTKYIGETLDLTATVKPDNTTNKNVIWSSSDSTVASVDQSGKVTMISAGTATITATSADDETKYDSAEITVLKKVNGFDVQPSIDNWVYGDEPSTPSCTVKGGTPAYKYEGRNGTEYGPSTEPPTKVGNYNLVVDVPESDNYQKINTVRVPFSITKRAIIVSGITAENKVYDGTTDAVIDCTTATLTGKLVNDDLAVSTTGAFANANAGDNKTVNLGTLTLSGDDVANYVLADAAKQQKTAKANIIPKAHNDGHDNTKPAGDTNPGDFKASADDITDKTFTGTAITPDNEIVVRDEKGNVIPNSQYDVTYQNNTNVGTATVKTKFKNNYDGVLNTTFDIIPKKHDDGHDNTKPAGDSNPGDFKASADDITDKTFTGTAITPDNEIVVRDEKGNVIPNSQYDVTYQNNTNVGTATVKIKFKNNYDGVLNTTFDIIPKKHNDGHDNTKPAGDSNPGDFKAEIEDIPTQYYTGTPLTPKPTVKDGNKILVEGVDYKIVGYEDNDKEGTAKLYIEFMGNYSGKATATFNIIDATPKPTGDSNSAILWLTLMFGGALLGITLYRKRRITE